MGERCNKGERGEGERWAQGLARFERRVEAPVLVLTRDDGAGPEARGAERGGGGVVSHGHLLCMAHDLIAPDALAARSSF